MPSKIGEQWYRYDVFIDDEGNRFIKLLIYKVLHEDGPTGWYCLHLQNAEQLNKISIATSAKRFNNDYINAYLDDNRTRYRPIVFNTIAKALDDLRKRLAVTHKKAKSMMKAVIIDLKNLDKLL